jgi:hypothetical protein
MFAWWMRIPDSWILEVYCNLILSYIGRKTKAKVPEFNNDSFFIYSVLNFIMILSFLSICTSHIT